MNHMTFVALLLLNLFHYPEYQVQAYGAIIERGGCGLGWDIPKVDVRTNTTYCYRFVFVPNIAFNWFDAWRLCKAENSELIVLDTLEEMSWFWKVITIEPLVVPLNYRDADAVGWYLNIHRHMYGDGSPSWADGRNISRAKGTYFTDVKLSAPRVFGVLDGEYTWACFYLNKNNRELQDIECGEKKSGIGYVCKKKLIPDTPPIMKACSSELQAKVTCPTGWVQPPSQVTPVEQCYYFATQSTIYIWDESFRWCKSMGGNLYYMDTMEEWDWVKAEIKKRANPSYAPIIAYYLNIHRYLYSNNGLNWANFLPYSFWSDSNYLGIENCGEILDSSLGFNDIQCSIRGITNYGGGANKVTHSFVCKVPKCFTDVKASEPAEKPKEDKGTLNIAGWKYKKCEAKASIAYICHDEEKQ